MLPLLSFCFRINQRENKTMSEYQMPPPNKVNSPQPGNGDEETIDLLELLYALLGKWREIAAATVACALIAAIGVLFL